MSLAEKFEVITDAVYAKGKNDDKSDFWDAFQNKGIQMTNYQYAFAYGHFSDENYNPKYKINPSYSCSNMFYSATEITDTKVDIDVRLATASTNVFRLASKLKTIRKIIVNERNTFVQWFTGCSSLENITFEGVIGNDLSFADCPLLAVESMLNIIDCLCDNEGLGITNTLTLGEANLTKLTEAQKETARNKGWNLI